jgi:hypothetical protein
MGATDAVRLRRCKDAAKVVVANSPDPEHFLGLVAQRLLHRTDSESVSPPAASERK